MQRAGGSVWVGSGQPALSEAAGAGDIHTQLAVVVSDALWAGEETGQLLNGGPGGRAVEKAGPGEGLMASTASLPQSGAAGLRGESQASPALRCLGQPLTPLGPGIVLLALSGGQGPGHRDWHRPGTSRVPHLLASSASSPTFRLRCHLFLEAFWTPYATPDVGYLSSVPRASPMSPLY